MLNQEIMDNPKALGNDTIVAWSWNGIKWPDGARQITYLSRFERDALRDWALYTPSYLNAQVFPDLTTARKFVNENARKRGAPYIDMTIGTIAELREKVGYPS